MISSNSVYFNYIICIHKNYWRNLFIKFSACILTSKFFLYYICNLHCFVAFNFFFFSVCWEHHCANVIFRKNNHAKTLRKWESEFSIKLEFDTNSDSKTYPIKCSNCRKWENRIISMKNFSKSWIIGTENV